MPKGPRSQSRKHCSKKNHFRRKASCRLYAMSIERSRSTALAIFKTPLIHFELPPNSQTHLNLNYTGFKNPVSPSDVQKSNFIGQPLQILHIAPELSLSQAILKLPNARRFNYRCIDKRTPGYHYPAWVNYGDVTEMEFADDEFDIIIANHVLEHIPNLQKALSELRRVLKPTGQAIFMLPITALSKTDDSSIEFNGRWVSKLTKQDRKMRFGQHDHVRLFGTDIVDIFALHGWHLVLEYDLNEAANKNLKLFPGEPLPIARPLK